MRTCPQRSSRRKMLTKGLGAAALASAGAGALLELSSGTALAGSVKPGVFASDTADIPAVSATGTNEADGVDASSDSGIGVFGKSSSGSGVVGIGLNGVSGTGGNIGVFGNSTTGGTGIAGTSSGSDSFGVNGQSDSSTTP